MKTFTIGNRSERTTGIKCNLCTANNAEVFLTGSGFNYVKCRNCGLVYQNPQPVFEDLRSRYGELYFRYEFENELNFFKLMILGMKDISFFDYPLDFFENTRFLDVGCATGMLIQRMKSLGWQAEGVEICRESAEYGIEKRDADIFVGTLEEAGFPDESFSVVHFSHLIEHVPDPARFLEEVFRILTKRGFAIVTTPNVAGFQARLFKTEWRSAIADHLTLFSAATLRKMLAKTGFKVLKSVTWGGLAKGAAPTFVKRPADYLAKKLGFGDVVLFFVQKDECLVG